MLRRKPTRVELSQVDVDELDLALREAEMARLSASAGSADVPQAPAQAPAPTRRETAVSGMSARERLGVTKPAAPADPGAATARRT